MSSILSSVEGGAIGVAVGEGAAAAVEPIVEPGKQDVWHANPYRVLDPEVLAQLVTQALVEFAPAADQARRSGFNENKFRGMVEATFKAPGTAEALVLWRRGRIDERQMRHALHKAGLETQYIDPVLELVGERLDPAIIANAIQQGFLDAPGVLAGDTGGTQNIEPPAEVVQLHDSAGSPVSAVEEARAAGISLERLKVEAELAGNPPAPEQLLEMWRRGIITETAVDRGIREGRTKTKWTSAFKALKRPLLQPATLINLLLRGWITKDDADTRMALHGYDPQQVQDWYDSAGRPMAPVQAFQAYFRGAPHPHPPGTPPPPGTFDEQDFVDAVRRSDIRPEYTAPLWHIRYAYPSLLQLRRAVESKALTPQRALQILKYERYEDQDAQALVASWTGGTTPAAKELTKGEILREYESKIIDRATAGQMLLLLGEDAPAAEALLELSDYRSVRTSLTSALSRIRTLYTGFRISRLQASTAIDELGIPTAARDAELSLWDDVRSVNAPVLTPAQIATLAQRNIWSPQQTYNELTTRGYSDRDARALLALHRVTL